MKKTKRISKKFIFLIDKISDIFGDNFSLRSVRTYVYLNNDIFIETDKNKEYFHISLNFAKPFAEITDSCPKELRPDSSLFAQNIKKYFSNAKFSDFKQVNNDRIISFKLNKTFENYETFSGTVYVELFSNHPNIIIVDENENIIFAKHYTNVQSLRLILNSIKYTLPEKKFDFNPKNYHIENYINDYNYNLFDSIAKNQNLDLFKLLKNKVKNISKKIESLKQQKLDYSNYYIYKDAADLIYCDLDAELKEIEIEGTVVKLDPTLNNIGNANKLYKKYKKSKKGIEIIEDLISKTIAELDYFKKIELQLINYNLNDLNEIRYQLTKDGYLKNKSNVKLEKPSFTPYYIEINNTKIAYGKNNIQNDTLTFNLSKPEYYFMHIKDYHGAHVVIFNDNPDKEIIKIAAELTLFMSNKTAGDIQLADIKDVKKTSIKGKVFLNKYEIITINNYDTKFIQELIRNSKRF